MTLAIGTVLENRYRIEELLGQGGMGAVYRAHDVRLEKAVAIKENTMPGAAISPEASQASRRQFQREALMLARLRHPSLPNVTDHFIAPDGNQYLVMDHVAGDDLAQIIARAGPLPEAQAVAWISQVCSALEYLHTQDPPIVHRDIKPQNIKVTPKGQVFLVDFGIAKVGEVSKTATGALGVTPGFSPPEQYTMSGTDARSDVYALGATLYAALTGQIPPESINLMSGEVRLTPPGQLNASVTPGVQQAMLAAMQPRKTDRPQTVAEFRQMLTLNLAKASEPSQGLPPTRLMGAAYEAADQPKPAVRPLAPVIPTPRPAPAPARAERNPLLWIGAGIAALVLVVLVVTAVSKPQATRTPPPTARPTATPGVTTKPAPATQPPATAPAAGATRVSEKDGMVMVYAPAGEFLMGSADADIDAILADCKDCKRDWFTSEQPQHTVYLDALWIDKTEMTNALYEKCVQAGTCKASSYASDSKYNGDSQPVVGVDWNDATTYCQWAGRQLPTEAQWEKAARGTDGRIYPWGNQPATCEYAVMNDGSGNGCGKNITWPVGSKPKGVSPYGALDMAGNVFEWVADWYNQGYYASSPPKNPHGPSSGGRRMLRGGCWYGSSADALSVRAVWRGSFPPDIRAEYLGFRCALVPGG